MQHGYVLEKIAHSPNLLSGHARCLMCFHVFQHTHTLQRTNPYGPRGRLRNTHAVLVLHLLQQREYPDGYAAESEINSRLVVPVKDYEGVVPETEAKDNYLLAMTLLWLEPWQQPVAAMFIASGEVAILLLSLEDYLLYFIITQIRDTCYSA